MTTCKTCKNWRYIRDESVTVGDSEWPGPHGECRIIDEDSQKAGAWVVSDIYEPANWVNTGPELSTDGALVTSPDFGCKLWEAKNEEP